MANAVIADAGLLVAYVTPRDHHHRWAVSQAKRWPPPWTTCEAALTETFFIVDTGGAEALYGLLRRGALQVAFDLGRELDPVLTLMEKYTDVPMSLADACIVRMTEIVADPVVLTTDADFRIYRRHSRRVVPHVMP